MLVLAWLAGCGGGQSGTGADLAPDQATGAPFDLSLTDSFLGGNDGPPLAPEMVRVPAGAFMMGCNAAVDLECLPDERPYHMVTLDGYDIDRLPATQGDYNACVMAGVCIAPLTAWDPAGHAAYPVNYVSWQQAVDYCKYRGKRLPTEAEWEKAARGGDGRKYPWGNVPAPDCTLCNASPCARKNVEPVGMRAGNVSPYGALDMAGNIWQWVGDWYDAGYYSVSPAQSPTGPAAAMGLKAKRGGAFSFDFAHLRTSTRYAHNPLAPDVDIGMRCAR